jgi:hypothetical protein
MQQPQEREVTVYTDIAEVRMETRTADCKKLLAAGWVLLGVYPLTTKDKRKELASIVSAVSAMN